MQLFVQFAPYDVAPSHGSWTDPLFKEAFADRVFRIVDEYAPGVCVCVCVCLCVCVSVCYLCVTVV